MRLGPRVCRACSSATVVRHRKHWPRKRSLDGLREAGRRLNCSRAKPLRSDCLDQRQTRRRYPRTSYLYRSGTQAAIMAAAMPAAAAAAALIRRVVGGASAPDQCLWQRLGGCNRSRVWPAISARAESDASEWEELQQMPALGRSGSNQNGDFLHWMLWFALDSDVNHHLPQDWDKAGAADSDSHILPVIPPEFYFVQVDPSPGTHMQGSGSYIPSEWGLTLLQNHPGFHETNPSPQSESRMAAPVVLQCVATQAGA